MKKFLWLVLLAGCGKKLCRDELGSNGEYVNKCYSVSKEWVDKDKSCYELKDYEFNPECFDGHYSEWKIK